ncbi:MAG: hypothetical protein FWD36_03510 [Treponema sp.]|nr:hypothetical protein [Treponema sp.]
MKLCGFDRYEPMETALKEAGLQVDEVVKQGKKTVVTVTRYIKGQKNIGSAPKTGRR